MVRSSLHGCIETPSSTTQTQTQKKKKRPKKRNFYRKSLWSNSKKKKYNKIIFITLPLFSFFYYSCFLFTHYCIQIECSHAVCWPNKETATPIEVQVRVIAFIRIVIRVIRSANIVFFWTQVREKESNTVRRVKKKEKLLLVLCFPFFFFTWRPESTYGWWCDGSKAHPTQKQWAENSRFQWSRNPMTGEDRLLNRQTLQLHTHTVRPPFFIKQFKGVEGLSFSWEAIIFFFFAIFVHYIYFGLENKNKMLVPMKIRKNVTKSARKNRKNKTAHPQQGWSGMCNGEHSFLESLIYKRCLSQDNNCYISRNKTTETKWKYTRGTTRGRPDHRGEGEGGQGAISIYTSTEKIKKNKKTQMICGCFFSFVWIPKECTAEPTEFSGQCWWALQHHQKNQYTPNCSSALRTNLDHHRNWLQLPTYSTARDSRSVFLRLLSK